MSEEVLISELYAPSARCAFLWSWHPRFGCSIPILNVPKQTGTAALEFNTRAFGGRITARLTDSYVGYQIDTAFSTVKLPRVAFARADLDKPTRHTKLNVLRLQR